MQVRFFQCRSSIFAILFQRPSKQPIRYPILFDTIDVERSFKLYAKNQNNYLVPIFLFVEQNKEQGTTIRHVTKRIA